MATVTANKTWVSGETVTPAGLNLTAAPTVVVADNEITTAKILDANVTNAKLATAVQQALLPAGAVQAFAMNSAPAGWLAANGSNVNRTTYAALFSAIGTTYGAGDGSTTFALPDLRGYFVRGSGVNGDGTAAGTFGEKQADAFGSHAHTATTASAGSHTHTTGGRYVTVDGGSAVTAYGGPGTYNYRQDVNAAGAHTHTVTVAATGDTETRPKNIAMLYCIKF
jgi:microcystin-dependent protein